jgi:hypothetical protein
MNQGPKAPTTIRDAEGAEPWNCKEQRTPPKRITMAAVANANAKPAFLMHSPAEPPFSSLVLASMCQAVLFAKPINCSLACVARHSVKQTFPDSVGCTGRYWATASLKW